MLAFAISSSVRKKTKECASCVHFATSISNCRAEGASSNSLWEKLFTIMLLYGWNGICFYIYTYQDGGFMVTSKGSNFLLCIGKEKIFIGIGNIVLHQLMQPIPFMEASDNGLFHGLI
jgi:hypothetical protein